MTPSSQPNRSLRQLWLLLLVAAFIGGVAGALVAQWRGGGAVRAYLLANPQVLREAAEALRQADMAEALTPVRAEVERPFAGAVLGNVLIFGDVFYRVYDPGRARWGVGAASDQAMAGGLMMIEGSVLTICLLAWLFLKTAQQTDERQELVEFARGNGVELTDSRAARAVAAGRGDELRERIVAGSLS